MSFILVQIRARYEDAGVPARGTVTFQRNASLADPATDTISPNDIRHVKLDGLGSISIELEANDSPGTVPANTVYNVTEIINGGKRTYPIQVLVADAAAGIELADVAPATPGPLVLTYALQAMLDAEVARAIAAEAALQGQIGSGSGDKHYRHLQSSAATTWHIVHNLGKRPSIQVVDTAGNVMLGDVQYDLLDPLNQADVDFTAPFSGEADCN
jgi:hypothetical protein